MKLGADPSDCGSEKSLENLPVFKDYISRCGGFQKAQNRLVYKLLIMNDLKTD